MRTKLVYLSVLLSAAATGGAALAQSAGPAPEVRVQASRVIKKEIGRSASTGAPIETAEITMRVSYADLRLDTNSGQALLKSRVADAAKDACSRISSVPGQETSDNDCIRAAVSGAKPQVDAAIAGANAQR